MNLNLLAGEALSGLYRGEMMRAFPPSELKPLSSIQALCAQNRYEPLGVFDAGRLLGYAFVWLEPGVPFALLDYLGTVEGLRGQGFGALTLELLARRYARFRGIFGEVEAPEYGIPEEEGLRRRRLGFYRRCGFRQAGYDCALFGVHYRTLIRGEADVSVPELVQAHQRIYRAGLPAPIYDRFIQIPLESHRDIRPVTRWRQDGEEPDVDLA